MSNFTTDDLLEEKLLKIWRTENEDLMRTFIVNTLHGNRAHALAFFEKIISNHQGKMRFKILELLMLDPSKDLVPLVITALRLERNVLFAKSLLFLYGNFDFPEALEALMAIESEIHFDLEKSYQKVAGKLKARFREVFYISEFEQGEKSAKRMSHAAEMMVKEPHPTYLPFLNKMTRKGNLQMRKLASNVLASIGNAESLDALFEGLPLYIEGRNKSKGLGLYLRNEKTYENPKLAEVLSTLGLLGEWEPQQLEALEDQLRHGEVANTMALVKETLLPDDTLITQDIFRFLSNFLAGGAPPKAEVKRVERLFDEHYESLTGQLVEALSSIGHIGFRENIEGLQTRVSAALSNQSSDSAQLMAAFLGGYKTDASREMLLDLLTPEQDPFLAGKVLSSLEHYSFDKVPEPILRLASSATDGLMRQGCLNLIANAKLLPDILDQLFQSEANIVLVDTIQTVASYQVAEGYPRLLKMLDKDLNPRILEVILSALESFPSEETGQAVKPFLMLPHSYLIRFAALKTLVTSGGPDRIGLLLGAMEDYPEKSKNEMLASFLKLIAADWQPDLMKHLPFWRDLLNEERYISLRPQAMDLLEKVSWEEVASEALAELFQKSAENDRIKRTSQENKALRIFALRVRAILEKSPGVVATPEKASLTLGGLLDKLAGASLHQKVRTCNLLLLHFQNEWYQPGETDSERLVTFLSEILCSDMGLPELTKMALTLAIRLKHTGLIEEVENALPKMSQELAGFARKLLEEVHHSDVEMGQPIQSILVLDDTVLIAKSLQRFLGKSGFEVEAFTHAAEAFETLSNRKYDLLIVDYLMPGKNGFEFINEIRQREISPPNIIMVTSSREHDVIRTAAQMRVNGLLLKPFPIPDLLEKIQHMRVH